MLTITMNTHGWSPRNPFPGVDLQGTCAILIPGTWCDGRIWQTQIEMLKDAGINAVALDTSSFDSIESLTRAVLAQAPRRFSVAGFSSGGYCALDLVRQAPERVDRLALVATQASAVDEATEKPQTLAMLNAARINPITNVVRSMLPGLLANAGQEHVRHVIEAMAISVGIGGLENQVKALLNRCDSTSLLPSITQRTLVVAGEHDALIHAEQQRIMTYQIRHSSFVLFSGVGHMIPIENPVGLGKLMVDWFGR